MLTNLTNIAYPGVLPSTETQLTPTCTAVFAKVNLPTLYPRPRQTPSRTDKNPSGADSSKSPTGMKTTPSPGLLSGSLPCGAPWTLAGTESPLTYPPRVFLRPPRQNRLVGHF